MSYRLFTLVVEDAVLRKRVLDPQRDSGWRNAEGSVAINLCNQERPLLPHEIRVNSSELDPDETAEKILGFIEGK